MTKSFEALYPNLTTFVQEDEGWIAIGRDEYSSSLIRVLNPGGMIWESKKRYKWLDDALAEADKAVADWLQSIS